MFAAVLGRRNVAILCMFSAFLLSACQSPITYAEGKSASNLPAEHKILVFEGVSEGSMLGDKSLPDSSTDQARYNQIVKEEMFSMLPASDISLVMSREQCSDCMGVKGLVYVLPFNPIIGGHVNIFMKTYDAKGEELFTAFFGHDFGLVTMAALGGHEDIVRRAAKKTAERLTEELRKRGTN